MDGDSWPFFELLLSLFLTGVFSLCAGILVGQNYQKENSDSGLGISFSAVSAFILCVLFFIWSALSIGTVSRSLAEWIVSLIVSGDLPGLAVSAVCAVFCVLIGLFSMIVFIFLPLSWGRADSELYAKKLKFLVGMAACARPLAKFVTLPGRRLMKARGVENDADVTEEDVLELVGTVEELDVIDENQKEMIGNIFELDDVTAGDIMTHRTEMESVPITASLDDIIAIAVEYGYSRIPVYSGTLDNIVGIAYVKDLLKYVGKGTKGVNIKGLYRPALFVPESCRARDLLLDFKQKKIQLAVVVDEYGGTAGIVSMEDILESIVGDIEDEYDEEESYIVRNADGSLVCNGYAEIEDVFELLGMGEVPDEVESDTIGGLLTDILTRIPKKGEQPTGRFCGLELTALDVDERRITSVLVRRLEDGEA